MKIKIMPVGLIGTNCYILSEKNETLIIDPGGDPDQIIDYLEKEKLTPLAILLTHAHFDHIGGLEELRKKYEIGVYINELEQSWLGDPMKNGSHKMVGHETIAANAENMLKEGKLTIGSFNFDVIHTPGHSPGSVSFVFPDSNEVFSGDVLFKQGIGRTDLPGGDFSILEHSIREKLYLLNDVYKVFPGHGPTTTIAFEKKNNPFITD